MIYPNTLLVNRYLVVRQIGEGGQGAVYEAIDERLGHRVALKEIMINDPGVVRAFEREGRILASLDHPALPRVSNSFRDGESQFLVMQYIPGDDLDKLLRKQRYPFQVQEVVTWGEQLLDVLDYLHSHSPPIIHRDIKPANLKLSARGQLILLDFGISKGGLTGKTIGTSGKSIHAFTPHFAPLEQINGQGTDERSDLYSLAATLYYLLTAIELPTAVTRAGAQITQNAEPLVPANQLNPQVPIALANLLTQAMSLNPAQRPPNAAAMRIALEQATSGSPRRGVTPPSRYGQERAAYNAPERPDQYITVPANAHLPPRQSENWPRSAAVSSRGLAAIGILALLAAVSLLLVIVFNQFSSPSEGEADSAAVVSPVPTLTSQATEAATLTLEPSTAEATPVAPSATALATSTPQGSVIISENETEQLAPTETAIETATQTPALPDENARFSEKDGMIMLWVPAGDFLMGSLNDEPLAEQHEKPQRTVYLDDFWIDQTEVTNAMFARFVEETGHKSYAESEGYSYVYVGEGKWEEVEGASWQHPRGPDCNCADEDMAAHPVVQVSWNDARQYCEWAGRRLPTEAEWEKAARGTDGRLSPWGNQEVAGNLVNYCDNNCLLDWAERNDDDGYKFTAPVGSYPAGASPFGALDMTGNAWEWVADWYDGSYYNNSPNQNPPGAEIGEERVLRGGSWSNSSNWMRSALRYRDPPADPNDERGFRCVSSP